MTNYALSIRNHNIKAHLDIEDEIGLRKDGLLTFTLRVNNGNIVDLNITEYVPVKKKYGIIKALIIEQVTVQEFPPTPNSGE